jgi:hypothetical protein
MATEPGRARTDLELRLAWWNSCQALAVDPPLNTPAMIGFGCPISIELIIVHTASHGNACKTTAIFKSFYRIYRKHSLPKVGMEFIEYRFPQANRNIF